MVSNTQSKPDFLSRAKLVSENKQPEFLSRAKKIEESDTSWITDEKFERDLERGQAMTVSRAGEAVLGLPGDLINFVGGLIGYDVGAPGSKKLQEVSEELTGGYTKPRDELEERFGETIQDMALFALPGAKFYSAARNIGIPVVANLVKEGVKRLGGEDSKQNIAKLGTMVLLDVLGHRANLGTAKEYASSLFQKAEEKIPKGLSIKSTNLEKSLETLERSMKMGGERPATGDALKKISEIKNEIQNGKIDLKSLVAYRPAINEWIDKYKGFEIGSSPKIRKQIIHNLNQVKGEVIKAAEEYGSKYNPEYLQLSQNANEAYAAVQQSNKIKNVIEKYAGSKLKSTGAKALLGTAYIGGPGILSGSLGLAGAALGTLGYKIFKTILRSKSPTLRKHYFNILEGAAKGNAAQVIKNAKFLDKELMNLDETGEINQYIQE